MNAATKVAEIEKTLLAAHERDPYHSILVLQLCAIARQALETANDQWRRHDKRKIQTRQPSLFACD